MTPERRAEIKRLQTKAAEIRVHQAAERYADRKALAAPRTARRSREHRSTSRVSRRVATATSGSSSGEPGLGDSDPEPSPAAVDALTAAADELRRIEADWNPLPAERCRCERPWLEQLPYLGLHCQRCGHDRQALVA